MVPQSNLGKIASLIFMIVGIPYFALMTTFISANINLMFNKLRNAVRDFYGVERLTSNFNQDVRSRMIFYRTKRTVTKDLN